MPDEMLAFSRLYAYPAQPAPSPPGGRSILDSGAFGLSQRGSAIDQHHMRRLAKYYQPYVGQHGYWCIAPDVFLDPHQTMRNWEWWQANVGLPVVPVIQFPHKRQINLYSVVKQAHFYAPWRPECVAISNPALRAIESDGIEQVCQVVRSATGATWLHNLGAGWDPADIAAWRELNCFDSIDSIAYYTDAMGGWLWRRDGKREPSELPWREIALENARVATEIARNG